MLYITTRTNENTYTSYKALTCDRAPDGGRFVPFRMPFYTPEEIGELKDKSFNQTVADILNLFFSSRLTGWDIDFCIGKNAIRLVSMNHRVVVSELWHNPEARFSYIINSLYKKLLDNQDLTDAPVDWVMTAVRIAVIFASYGEMLRTQLLDMESKLDISVPSGDFLTPMAVWYARKMGLPVNTIICACEENSNVWDLIHRGVFNTMNTSDAMLLGLEKLIQATLGFSEVQKFRQSYQSGLVYSVNEDDLPALSNGFFCAVAGENRAGSTINSIFRSNSYVIDPLTALCYGGLQDYRARTGSARITLLLADRTPLDFAAEISAATGIEAQKLINYVTL